jgi:RNA polymerase sigma factor (sigma-70 family)
MGFLRCEASTLGELITEAQNPGRRGDRAIREIMWRFERLVRKIGRVKAFGQTWREDVEGAARFGLTQAVARHRGSADTFPAYAKLYMVAAAKREAARWADPHGWSLVELTELECVDRTSLTPVEDAADQNGWGSGNTADAIAELRPDQRHLLSRRYRDQAHLAEIADETGCSVPAVSQRLSTVHRRLADAVAA